MGDIQNISKLRIAIVALVAFFIFWVSIKVNAQDNRLPVSQVKSTAVPTPTASGTGKDLEAIEAAVFDEIASRKQEEFLYSTFGTRLDKIEISTDNQYAYAWMGIVNPLTQESMPSEPGLALLRFDGMEWQVVLPSDPEWETWLEDAPGDLIPQGEKDVWQEMNAVYADALPLTPIAGYRLPWEAGRTVYLSGSVAHDEYITSGNSHFAFDFYIPATMFNVFASRAGTVYMFHDSQPNGDENSPGNYLVLKDTTTYPVTYQLYLHLAQASIPPELRSIGTPVARGQFIGIADDTGASTGHHLHYQVHTNPSSYWGRAVDITFDDVSINGGRPRILKDKPYCTWAEDVCNTFQTSYISGNTKSDPNPPTGDLIGLSNGQIINSSSFDISGWAADAESGLRSIQVIAAFNNTMHDIGPVFTTSPFSFTFDVCQAGVADGPLSLGLRIMDKQSNIAYLPGLVTLTKNYRCVTPPATCQAGANQVALFDSPDYHGACVVLNPGSYLSSALGAVGDDNLESIKIGANVMATLFVDNSYQGRSQTVFNDNSNLRDDLVNVNSVSSLIIAAKSQPPAIPQPIFPADNDIYIPGNPLTFYWRNVNGAAEFQVQIVNQANPDSPLISNWLDVPYWSLGADLAFLSPGNYTWQVRGRNPTGTSVWSPAVNLTVSQLVVTNPTQSTLPFQDDVEILRDWIPTGLWHREAGTSPIPAHSGNYYYWFGEASNGDERYFSAKQGTLTSPVFTLPAGSTYYLRFWYAYQTESEMGYWDQRWVQVSVNGGPFVNHLQLRGETMNSAGYAVWLPSPVVDLSMYAGSSIQIRFTFDTIDPSGSKPDNDFEGWFIDDISITTQPPAVCSNTEEPNETPGEATLLAYSPASTISAEICPNGDLDFYKFWGTEGDLVAANTDAKSFGSNLDTVVTLLDADGRSVLAENDDEDNPGGILDSLLVYRIRRTGWYYLRVRSWDYPAGGLNYPYILKLLTDETLPTLDLLVPDEAAYGASTVSIKAQAADVGSSIERVRFYWHNPDWSDPAWTLLGEGIQNGGVWEISFNPADKPEGTTGALYAIASDQAGNIFSDGAWNQKIDHTPPTSEVINLSPTQTSTAIAIRWQGQDTVSGLLGYDLQVSVDGGAWVQLNSRYFYPLTSTWHQVEPGHLYAYRIRAIDQAGNLEAYPISEDTVTYVPSAAELCSQIDVYENDTTWGQAPQIALDGIVRQHNLCNPLNTNFITDQDWSWFQVPANQRFSIMAIPVQGSPAYLRLILYQRIGNDLVELKRVASSGYGIPVWLNWTAPAAQVIYLRAESMVPGLIGEGTAYSLQVYPGAPRITFFPTVNR